MASWGGREGEDPSGWDGVAGEEHGAGVEHVGDEEGQGGGPLWLHPLRHPRRHELRAQAPSCTAPLPHLGRPDRFPSGDPQSPRSVPHGRAHVQFV